MSPGTGVSLLTKDWCEFLWRGPQLDVKDLGRYTPRPIRSTQRHIRKFYLPTVGPVNFANKNHRDQILSDNV
jgi:hypothetical protein